MMQQSVADKIRLKMTPVLAALSLLAPGLYMAGLEGAAMWVSYLTIGGACLVRVMLARRYFSCDVMHWLYLFFFMYISPTLQYILNAYTFTIVPQPLVLFRSNMMLLMWIAAYCAVADTAALRGARRMQAAQEQADERFLSVRALRLFMLFSLMAAVFVLARGGVNVMLTKSAGEAAFGFINQAGTLILTFFMRNGATFAAAYAILGFKAKKWGLFWPAAAVLLLLISCSPFGMPRFQAAAIYIGLMLIAFPGLSRRSLYVYGFVVVFLIGFPFINHMREENLLDLDIGMALKDAVKNMVDMLIGGHFDGYAMLFKAQHHVATFGLSWGRQMLGAMLFFIPRAWWPDKPTGSGHLVQQSAGLSGPYLNMSASLIEEGYINFGFCGILLFAGLMAFMNHRLDTPPYGRKENGPFKKMVYPFLPPMVFFMVRGDMMSTFAYFSSYVAIGSGALWMAKRLGAKE